MRPILFALVVTLADAPTVTRVRIPVKPRDQEICAAYISAAFPRDVQWACKDASEVRDWILRDGRPTEECSE